MSVTIGSARIDENGKSHGGAAGDQTGKELSTQSWYKHKKGWVVLRPKDPAKAKLIAACMRAACKNSYIGYDQYQRDTLYNEAKKYGFDVSKVTKKVETDCSALVRVCCAYAGIMVENFRTTNEASVLMASGEFIKLTASKYTGSSAYLKTGDILNTLTQGHTVVVLTDGSKAETAPTAYVYGDRVCKRGSEGADVKTMQAYLIALGISCGSYGADGDFGSATEKAVSAFQSANGINSTGIADKSTLAAIKTCAEGASAPDPVEPDKESGDTKKPPYEAPTGSRSMSRGNTGEAVKWLQWALIALGISCGACGIDGDFGSATRKAVIAFQKRAFPDNPSEWDGIVGVKTLAKLKAAL